MKKAGCSLVLLYINNPILQKIQLEQNCFCILQPIFEGSGKIQVANKKYNFSVSRQNFINWEQCHFPICNQKLKWNPMYLIFLHILSKFHDIMIISKGPTSIIAFGGKMKQLFFHWQLEFYPKLFFQIVNCYSSSTLRD